MFGAFRAARDRVRDKNRFLYLDRILPEVSARRDKAANEYRRLGYLYSQLQDWAVVISTALNRPLGEVEHHGVEPWRTNFGTYSFVSATPTFDESEMVRTALHVSQLIANVGWLARAFERQSAMISGEYLRRVGGVGGANRRPQDDNSLGDQVQTRVAGPNGEVLTPRVDFRNQYVHGRAADTYRGQLIGELATAIQSDDPASMISGVQCDIPGLNSPPSQPGRARTVAEFLAPVVEYSPGVQHLEDIVDASAIVSDGLAMRSVVGISAVVPAKLRTDRVATIVVGPVRDRLTLAAFRLDLTDPVPPSKVSLISARVSSHGGIGGVTDSTDLVV